MSDSTKNEEVGFFNNKEIPNTAKLGAIAILLNGTFETYKRAGGNITTFVSHVGGKN